MGSGRCGAVAAILFLSLCSTARAGNPSGPLPAPLKDWPCQAEFADQLHSEALWPTALPAPLPPPDAWEADAQARQLVDFIASPENSAKSGSHRIEEFVNDNGKLRPELAMLVLTGTVERINKIRDILIEGIRTHVIRSHILAQAVEENDKSLALAAAEPVRQPDAIKPDAIQRARLRNLRSLDEAGDGAAMLCHRYSYDEGKAKALATALQQHTQPQLTH
jgi:hypothetical protein